MKVGKIAGKVPVGAIAKRLPVPGRKKSPLGKVVSSLPLPKSLPGGRTAGTAGGLLLGAGAAVAANRAMKSMSNNRSESDGDSGGKPAAAESKKDVAKKPAKAEADTGRDDTEVDKDQESEDGEDEGKKKGIFGRMKDGIGNLFKKKGGGGGGSKKLKLTNIVEYVDVGAPQRLVYDQFTQFQEFPGFMKKVVSVDQSEDEKLNWKAKIFWSNRTWEATIVEQIPDQHIVWKSKGAKGHVDGTVSFHKLSENLTRVLINMEYHPQGLFERTGNMWRAQGRRARLELKHFRRHVMTQSLVKADEIEGWRGEIRDSEVVKTHEDAVAEEEKAQGGDDSYEYEDDSKAKSDTKSSRTADSKSDTKSDTKSRTESKAKTEDDDSKAKKEYQETR